MPYERYLAFGSACQNWHPFVTPSEARGLNRKQSETPRLRLSLTGVFAFERARHPK